MDQSMMMQGGNFNGDPNGQMMIYDLNEYPNIVAYGEPVNYQDAQDYYQDMMDAPYNPYVAPH